MSSIEINGQLIANETVTAHSMAYSLGLLGLSIVLFGIAIRNHRLNTKTVNCG
jgi:Ca2+/H+ antiporter